MNQIKIMGQTWAIETKADMSHFGECDADHRVIRLRESQSREQMAETLLHEILHAIYAITDIRDKDGEETTVTRLAAGLASVFLDEANGEFRKAMNGGNGKYLLTIDGLRVMCENMKITHCNT